MVSQCSSFFNFLKTFAHHRSVSAEAPEPMTCRIICDVFKILLDIAAQATAPSLDAGSRSQVYFGANTGSTSKLKPCLSPGRLSPEVSWNRHPGGQNIGGSGHDVDRKRDSGRYFLEKAAVYSPEPAFLRNSFGGAPACFLKALLKTDFELNPAS
jgi:hypothetical protein